MISKVYGTFLRENPKYAVLNVLFMLLVPLNEIYLAKLYGGLFDKIRSDTLTMRSFSSIVLMMAFLFVGFACADKFNAVQGVKFQAFCKLTFVRSIFSRYERVGSVPFIGESMAKLQKTQQILSEWFGKLFGFFIPIVLQSVFTVGYFMWIDSKLGSLVGAMVMVFGWLMMYGQRRCNGQEKIIDKKLSDIHDRIEDVITNHVSVYKEERLDSELSQIEQMYQNYADSQSDTVRCGINYRLLVSTIVLAFMALVFKRCFEIFRMQKLQQAVFYSIVMMMANLISNMVYMINLHRDMIFDYIHLNNSGMYETVTKREHTCDSEPSSPTAFLELSNVEYLYPNKVFPTLLNVNLSVDFGEKLAIVGKVGSGKSTLLRVIQRLLVPTDGNVFLMKRCISEYSVRELYNIMVFMPQGAPMFKRSVFENMIYYAKDTTMETVQDILKRFQLDNHFPNGLDTLATSLSGGQRQLVWFVRIYLKNADLIIMDEPTSSLDQGTKQIFVEKMNEMFAKKTVIVVTHDPYLSKHMRRVVDIGSINKMNSKST